MIGDLKRFLELVDRTEGDDACHPWVGPVRNDRGYGAFYVDGNRYVAHRWLLGHLRGRPLDWPAEIGCHTCDNPRCCNPKHLYVGSHHDNTMDAIARSGHPAAARRAQTHCVAGHPYDAENTHQSPNGWRYCRTCKRNQSRRTATRSRRARGTKRRVRLPDGRFSWVAA